MRVSEIKKAMYEFKRDIVTQAVNSRTGIVMAERVLRYYDDKIRGRDAVIEKLRLKNVTLKVLLFNLWLIRINFIRNSSRKKKWERCFMLLISINFRLINF